MSLVVVLEYSDAWATIAESVRAPIIRQQQSHNLSIQNYRERSKKLQRPQTMLTNPHLGID